MELFLIIVGCALVWLAIEVGKEMHLNAEHRRNDRIMAAYLREEEARAHRWRLAAIEATVEATIDDLDRIAAEASGDVIEGTAMEVHP